MPPPDDAVPAEPGLLSVVAGAHAVLIRWRGIGDVSPGSGAGVLALFGGLDPATVYAQPPFLTAPAGESLVVEGLPAGTTVWLGLGFSSDGGATWKPIGPRLSATTRAPLYVDAAASGAVVDGLTPETAFTSPLPALLTALVQGGGNVWIASGTYADSALPVFAGVAVAGGFAPGFVLAERDPVSFPVVLRGVPGQPVCDVQGGGTGAVLDGLELDGLGQSSAGLRVTDTPLEGRGLVVRRCAGPGIDLRGGENGDPLLTVLVDCRSFDQAAEGLTGHGALELQCFGVSLSANAQEGLDLQSLVAPDGRTTRLRARGCSFLGNGTEGADVDLAAPLTGGVQGGRFELSFESSAFSGNGGAGLRIDIDHEAFPEWSSDIVVRGCVTRANGADGVSLDLDGPAEVLLHRLSSSCNAGDGVHVTSELEPVLPVVSASALVGNAGCGLRAVGAQASVIVAGSILAGNDGGGLLTDSPASAAVSSVAWRQASPWPAALAHHVVVSSDPSTPLFERAPIDFGSVLATGAGSVTLGPGAPPILPGDLLEIDDDGVPRTATLVNGASVTLDPPPDSASAPRRWSRFAAGVTSVDEDWT
ncbi:MAG TPA: right-handed parallel beta-helix repeat-containing protein, partial [Planctomycetota bacterium]|nr:right-handed parallel beta-helix repeat-containing protein [Planctomycetota bacterium]